MEFTLRTAERKQAKIKLGLQGPSGSGKTYSALLLAYGLCGDWKKIGVIDSENHSADLYAHLGNYNVLNLTEPFTPEMYVKAIEACEKVGMEVIIIDSISAEWEGSGGIIETHSKMVGNSFTNWNSITPRHNAFVQKILQSPCHVLATIRCKQDYVLSEKNGRYVPEKVGLKGVTRDGMDYEFTIVFDLDIKHQAKASKDRTGLFMDGLPFTIKPETGRKILDWCLIGKTLDKAKKELVAAQDVKVLTEVMKKYPEFKNELLQEFEAKKHAITFLDAVHAADDVKPKWKQ
jgi:hypothetical protein